METGLARLQDGLQLGFRDYPRACSIVRAAHQLVGLVVPLEFAASNRIPEGQERKESAEMNGIARRERAGRVSAGSLVGEDPEVKFRQEAREVREHDVGRRREGFHP